jgi:tellurite resistance protein TerC
MLALDLGVFHRKSHEVSFKEALSWSVVWIALALAFNVFILYRFGKARAIEYLTGYIIEKSLSIDNIFVFVLLFSSFNVPTAYQHKVLFWGVIGALGMRAVFIFAGVSLIERFHWIIYVFGVFLIYTGFKIAMEKGTKMDMANNKALRLVRRLIPVSEQYYGDKFFIRNGKFLATPLFLVLILVEITDLIFAIDSIPAILAITDDPLIVCTSNVFAIMGLRSLYFALAGSLKYFIYLHYGLAVILVFVGLKMLLSDIFSLKPFLSLAIIGFILIVSIIASVIRAGKGKI